MRTRQLPVATGRPESTGVPSESPKAKPAVTRLRLCPSRGRMLRWARCTFPYGPSPIAACICEPRVSCEPGVSEMARRLLHAAMGPAFQRLEAPYRYLDPSPVSFRLLGWWPIAPCTYTCSRSSKLCPTSLFSLLTSRIPEMPGKGPPECADGPQVLLPRALRSGTVPATTFPRLQAAVRANRLMDDPRFRWRGEGAPGQGWRPGSRPALLGRPGQIPGVPSRPKRPAQPLVRDVGCPAPPRRPGQAISL